MWLVFEVGILYCPTRCWFIYKGAKNDSLIFVGTGNCIRMATLWLIRFSNFRILFVITTGWQMRGLYSSLSAARLARLQRICDSTLAGWLVLPASDTPLINPDHGLYFLPDNILNTKLLREAMGSYITYVTFYAWLIQLSLYWSIRYNKMTWKTFSIWELN